MFLLNSRYPFFFKNQKGYSFPEVTNINLPSSFKTINYVALIYSTIECVFTKKQLKTHKKNLIVKTKLSVLKFKYVNHICILLI